MDSMGPSHIPRLFHLSFHSGFAHNHCRDRGPIWAVFIISAAHQLFYQTFPRIAPRGPCPRRLLHLVSSSALHRAAGCSISFPVHTQTTTVRNQPGTISNCPITVCCVTESSLLKYSLISYRMVPYSRVFSYHSLITIVS
jgi:hypothetical protein